MTHLTLDQRTTSQLTPQPQPSPLRPVGLKPRADQRGETPVPQIGINPDGIRFTEAVLTHANHEGITIEQMRAALRDPRWVNHVVNQPEPRNQRRPRLRYCGHGVAVIVEGNTAIAVIHDDLRKQPRNSQVPAAA